jgi:hypothetical protein
MWPMMICNLGNLSNTPDKKADLTVGIPFAAAAGIRHHPGKESTTS